MDVKCRIGSIRANISASAAGVLRIIVDSVRVNRHFGRAAVKLIPGTNKKNYFFNLKKMKGRKSESCVFSGCFLV